MSPTKKRQTMGKVTRERELKERRVLKQEKKDARKAAAAAERDGGDGTLEAAVDGEAAANDSREGEESAAG